MPDMTGLVEQIPALADPLVQSRIVQRETQPGFLGLNLPSSLASTLLECLIVAEASACRLPVAYRQPSLTLNEITALATHILRKQQVEKFPDASFGPIQGPCDHGVCLGFSIGSIRGILSVSVDKLDGHLWSSEELQHLYDESRLIRRKLAYAKACAAGLPMTRWQERFDSYDIVISRRCRTWPQLQELISVIPELANPHVQAYFLGDRTIPEEQLRHFRDLPFLGLALSYELAGQLAQRLQEAGAQANRIPIEYREPRIRLQEAHVLAEQEIMDLHEKAVPHDTLGPVELSEWQWTPYWVFEARSPELIAKGHIPGRLFAHIDKLDGHVWTFDEMYLFIGQGTIM
ncbi:hypothetical protein KDK_69190 [Dictyobacter kobayashii]|uniref:Uncharacterized protein n=1 Tax=Dictyobacter kobayashii TaxID=2014872 RepID=A0A402AVL1_9CHLR|nr:hypothetical protein KDK_69190 [Dictyobacter kobayashii]